MRRYSCLLVAGDYDGDSYNDSGIRTQRQRQYAPHYLNGHEHCCRDTGGVRTAITTRKRAMFSGLKKGVDISYIRNLSGDIIVT